MAGRCGWQGWVLEEIMCLWKVQEKALMFKLSNQCPCCPFPSAVFSCLYDRGPWLGTYSDTWFCICNIPLLICYSFCDHKCSSLCTFWYSGICSLCFTNFIFRLCVLFCPELHIICNIIISWWWNLTEICLAFWQTWLSLSVFFIPVLYKAQMNHTNDLGPVLQLCTEINI